MWKTLWGIRYLPLYPPQVSLLFQVVRGFALWLGVSLLVGLLRNSLRSLLLPDLADMPELARVWLDHFHLSGGVSRIFQSDRWGQTSAIALLASRRCFLR